MTRKQEIKRLKEIANNPQNYGEQFAKDAMEKLASIQAGKEILKQEFAAKKSIRLRFKELLNEQKSKYGGHSHGKRFAMQEAAKLLKEEVVAPLSLNEIVEAARQDLVEKMGFDPKAIEEKKD